MKHENWAEWCLRCQWRHTTLVEVWARVTAPSSVGGRRVAKSKWTFQARKCKIPLESVWIRPIV